MNKQLKLFLDGVFASNELNRLPQMFGGDRIFSAPLIGVSCGDDDLFEKLKEIIGPEHLTPSDMWTQRGLPEDESLAKRLRILSVVFPYARIIREEGEKNIEDVPPEIYCVARNFANQFMDAVLEQIVGYIQTKGFRAISGVKSGAFQILTKETPFRIYSNWSERHIAFASGLGTFSLHEGLITNNTKVK